MRNFKVESCVFVKSVGVEVECGVPRRRDLQKLWRWAEEMGVVERVSVGSDGSVYVGNCDMTSVEIRFWVETERWWLMKEFMVVLWRRLHIQQNRTCGNHVHLNIPEFYPILTYPEFIVYFERNYFNSFNSSKYRQRLDSNYSRGYFLDGEGTQVVTLDVLEEEIVRQCSGLDRYRSVNFWPLMRDPATVEFRIMPYATSAREHLSQITFVIRTVEEFIRSCTELSCCETPLELRELNLPESIEVDIPVVGDVTTTIELPEEVLML